MDGAASSPQAIDASITAFAGVRNAVCTSYPSFGAWKTGVSDSAYSADTVPAVVEVARGTPNKFEVDKDTGMLMLDRVLHSAVHYPGDYGYIPSTLCGDGDPLDIVIIAPYTSSTTQGLEPGSVANCRIVGVMDMEDEGGKDEKIISVQADNEHATHIQSIENVPPHLLREIELFFTSYKKLEVKNGKPKWANVLGWGGKDVAMKVLHSTRAAYVETQAKVTKAPQVSPPNMLHAHQDVDTARRGIVRCYINAPKGCTNSYQYRSDTSYRHFRYAMNMPYPGDYGFCAQTWQPGTQGAWGNGKPLETLIFGGIAQASESVSSCRIVGALRRSFLLAPSDTKRQTEWKLLAVLAGDPRMQHISTASDINKSIIAHVCTFFNNSARTMGLHDSSIDEVTQREHGIELFQRCHAAYMQKWDTPESRQVTNAPNLWCLPWEFDNESAVTAVIECRKGSSNKYEFSRELGHLVLDRPLHSAITWPGNYGFVPQTVAEDGKPVNVVVLSNAPLREFSLCAVRILGAIRCLDEKGPDIKLVAVPKKEPRMREWKEIDDVPKHIKDELGDFFKRYKKLEVSWKFCRVDAWMNQKEAVEYLRLAHTRFFLFVMPMERVNARLAQLEFDARRLKDENAALRAAKL